MDNNLYIVGDLDLNKFCQPCENYNIIIIIAACNLLGCTVPYYSASDTPGVRLTDNQIDECFNYTLCFGWIINYNRGHWVSLRRKHNEPDMVLYYNSTHELKKGIEMSLKQYKERYKSKIYGILPIMYDGENIVKDYIQELKPVKPLTDEDERLTDEDERLIKEIYKEQEEKETSDALKEQEQAQQELKDEILAKKLQQELEDEILANNLQHKEGCPTQKKYYRQYK
jgi:hypothetical protein